jgi:hypothetical protein
MITDEEKLMVLLKWGECIPEYEIEEWVKMYEVHEIEIPFIEFINMEMTKPLWDEPDFLDMNWS